MGQDSDLLLRMEGQHIIQAAIHTCLRCRYSGYPDDFGVTIPRPKAERFLVELSAKLAGTGEDVPPPDLQYFWAYKCASFLNRSERELAERLIRAFWCLRLPPSSELPALLIEGRRKSYLTGAIHHLRQDGGGDAAPVRFYLLAELNRRAGEFPVAVGYFKRFLDSSAGGRLPVPAYLRLAAMKLLRAAEHGDGRDRTMEEIVYADSPE